jgi:7-cyano-7-deazaguanine synthase
MSQTRQASVVLLSGGLDSTANLAFCRELDEPVLALTARYGQRAADAEVRAARALAERYGVRHEVVDLTWLGAMGGSALTQSSQAMPELRPDQLDEKNATEKSAKAVWVPNRNGVLINVAAAYAERLGATRVVVGFNREEAATFPDNSVEFLDRATRALEYSTANHVQVQCYTADLDKREIVAKLDTLSNPFPYEMIWSCYQAGPKHCGQCESCRRLARALGSREGARK